MLWFLLQNLQLLRTKPLNSTVCLPTENHLVTAAVWQRILYPTCRFSPAWLWWRRRTGRCLRRGSGRAPPEERSRSPLWSSYGLALPSGEGPGPQPGPRCSSQGPCRGRRPARRWGVVWGPGPDGRGCWRRAWWERWSLSCSGFLSWRPAPHLRGRAREDEDKRVIRIRIHLHGKGVCTQN